MTLQEAIQKRHSVRRYRNEAISEDVLEILQEKVEEVNAKGKLHIQLVTNEPKAYSRGLAYGTFRGVTNYFVMAGPRASDLGERIGYYGEQLVLLAQTLGLNTCWTGLTYSKTKGTYTLHDNERIECYIALGYGDTQGADHKIKSIKDVSNAGEHTPTWFVDGVNAALRAPTAINQQKFFFEYQDATDGKPRVVARRGFSIVGYTQIDLGIAMLHFEIGAGRENFEWSV